MQPDGGSPTELPKVSLVLLAAADSLVGDRPLAAEETRSEKTVGILGPPGNVSCSAGSGDRRSDLLSGAVVDMD